MSIPPILCVAGGSGSGKTTLLERLVGLLSDGGLTVGAIKRCSSRLTIGPPGKDSSRLAAAGARPMIASGPDELTVENAVARTGVVDLAATFCAGCDLVLVEGYKDSPHDKVLVVAGAGDARPELACVELVVAGEDRDDVARVAEWVRQWLDRRRRVHAGVVGAVLAGGESRRMGSDKAAMRVGGRSVLAGLVELLGGRLRDVWVIGRTPRGLPMPGFVRWHLDIPPGCGPLGGIATALRVAEGSAVLAVACDMPALAGEAVELLLAERDPSRPASAIRNPATGRLEPLAAVYEPHALPHVQRAIDDGRLSATELLESMPARRIEATPAVAAQLVNVNTPEQLGGLSPPA